MLIVGLSFKMTDDKPILGYVDEYENLWTDIVVEGVDIYDVFKQIAY